MRQGDPMSPYLFVIIVDFLTQLPNHIISRAEIFKYHWRCDKFVISHLCFVDDLLIFFHGNLNSGDVIKNFLVQLFNFIGLRANNKSCLLWLLSPVSCGSVACEVLRSSLDIH